MQTESLVIPKIEERCSELQEWILHNAPQCGSDQKQLVEGSPERGYWAHGYMTALFDVLRLYARDRAISRYLSQNPDSTRRAA